MMEDYLYSEATITEGLVTSYRVGASQAMRREIMKISKRKAGKAIKVFDTKWERAACGQGFTSLLPYCRSFMRSVICFKD